MSERAEPLTLASGRICVCGCVACRGLYRHCLSHDAGCHLISACDFRLGMICCASADERKDAVAVSGDPHLARVTRAALSSAVPPTQGVPSDAPS
jgi:hypothetical protein